jgi:hypothetical protein
MSSAQLFDELCIQFPGRLHPKHLTRLEKRVKQWRQDARARGVIIPPRKNRRFSNKPRGPAPVPYSCVAHLTEMYQWLEEHPDQTATELLNEFQARYPGIYRRSHLRTASPVNRRSRLTRFPAESACDRDQGLQHISPCHSISYDDAG